MRTILGAVMTCFLLFNLTTTGTLHTDTTQAITSKINMKKPAIVFDETVYDFGTQPSGTVLKHTFTFRNEGTADLVIDKVKGVCRCTAAIVSSNTIPPGETGRIEVSFDTKGYEGERSKEVTVFSNDPKAGLLNLEVKADLVVYFDTDKHRLYFGRIGNDQRITQTLHFRGKDLMKTRTGKITLEDPKLTDAFEWHLIDNRKDEKNPSLALDITLDPKKLPAGRFVTNLLIETDSPVKRTIKVLLAGHVIGPIACQPARLYFRSFEPGNRYEKTVVLTSENDPFKILNVDAGNPSFHFQYNAGVAAKKHVVTVIFTPGTDVNQIKTKLIITTDMAKQKEVSITVYGSGKNAQTIGFTSASSLSSAYQGNKGTNDLAP